MTPGTTLSGSRLGPGARTGRKLTANGYLRVKLPPNWSGNGDSCAWFPVSVARGVDNQKRRREVRRSHLGDGHAGPLSLLSGDGHVGADSQAAAPQVPDGTGNARPAYRY